MLLARTQLPHEGPVEPCERGHAAGAGECLSGADDEITMNITSDTINTVKSLGKYEAGFETDIEMDYAPKGLSEDIIRFISAKKEEPQWLLDWRLKAYAHWQKMPEPTWAKLKLPV